MLCCFIKYAHFLPLVHPFSASGVAKIFLDNVVKLHGVPQIIVSDRDKVFTNLFWEELFKSLGTSLAFSTAYHHQSDEETKRLNQKLEAYLRCMEHLQPSTWATWIAFVEWWYNISHHSTILGILLHNYQL